MNNMKTEFKILYRGVGFFFEFNAEDGMVWLLRENQIPNRINQGQVKPARNIDEAKLVAKEMLYSMGY